MTREEADLIIAEQNRSKDEILKAVAKVKSDYQELCNLKDMRIAELLGIIQGKDNVIKDLEWQLQEVAKDNDNYQAENKELEKENAELKSIADFQTSSNMDRFFQLKRSKERLVKAKEVIKGLLTFCRNYPQENAEKMYKAEQFLSEVNE